MTGKTLLVYMLLALAVVTLAGGSYWTWATTPPPMPQTGEEAISLLDSSRYHRLPLDQRYPYIKRAEDLIKKMPDQKRKELFKELIKRGETDPAFRQQAMQMQVERIQGMARIWAFADKTAKVQQIDKIIDMMEQGRQRRRDASSKGGGSGSAGASGNGDDAAERQAQRNEQKAEFTSFMHDTIESGNPHHQGYIGEFFKAVMDRRQERGMPRLPKRRDKK